MSKIDEILERLSRIEAKQDAHLATYAQDKDADGYFLVMWS
jgi:hypothetical protein